MSDLHLEMHADHGREFLLGLVPAAEVLLLAGDICDVRMLRGVMEFLCSRWEHVVYVPGNHEYYGSSPGEVHEVLGSIPESNFHWLDRSVVVVQNLRIAGTTLWFSPRRTFWNWVFPDRWRIRDFEPWVQEENSRSRLFIARAEADVLVTHHLPTWKSASDSEHDEKWNPMFVSDCEADLGRYRLVVHGHTHLARDYILGKTRVLCNPRGNPTGSHDHFDPRLVVSLRS
jgi:predicted phosphohydrolase